MPACTPCSGRPGTTPRGRRPRRRRGFLLVWLALLLTLLVGLTGLLVDGGLLMSSFRQAQNTVDAAALAAAMELLRGKPFEDVEAAAVAFVRTHNRLTDAEVVVNNPPRQGPYATVDSSANYVEVIVTNQITTYFVHLLPGVEQNQTVRTRAVAGFEALSSGEGAIVLDPRARPGLRVDGGATLQVDGSVIDNSRASGLDQYEQWLDTGYPKYAGEVSNNSTLRARYLQIVGGVDDVGNIENFDAGGPNPLFAGARIAPDPLADLPIPTPGNGADLTDRGAVSIGNSDPKPTMLNPGVYEDIRITQGAQVIFNPGIYLLVPAKPNQGLRINGSVDVTGTGVLFYATSSNYLENGAGFYDIQDGPVELDYTTDALPPPPDANFSSLKWSTIDINATDANISFSGLQDPDGPFHNLLFFQRRRSEQQVQLQGNAGSNVLLSGGIYAKWARWKLAGESRYDAQFVVGSMQVTGQAVVTIAGSGNNFGLAYQVFLVE